MSRMRYKGKPAHWWSEEDRLLFEVYSAAKANHKDSQVKSIADAGHTTLAGMLWGWMNAHAMWKDDRGEWRTNGEQPKKLFTCTAINAEKAGSRKVYEFGDAGVRKV